MIKIKAIRNKNNRNKSYKIPAITPVYIRERVTGMRPIYIYSIHINIYSIHIYIYSIFIAYI